MIATILNFLGSIASSACSTGCAILFIDEPKMPRSMIK